MSWIGIECDISAGELEKWARQVKLEGGAAVADLLARAADLISGANLGLNGEDRMHQVELRALDAVERKRNAAAARATAIVGKMMGEGVDMDAIAKAAGLDGWRDGSAAPEKNGGVKARRKRIYGNGRAAAGAAEGNGVECVAETRRAALSAAETVARDRRYGESFEGWCGVELRKMGFKMVHVARGVDLTVTEAWRHISGWSKHWRREGLRGRAFPGPQAGWADRLEVAAARARGAGLRGAHVVTNGSKDCGIGGEGPHAEGADE